MISEKYNKVSSNLTIPSDSGYYYSRSSVDVKGRYQNTDAILVTSPGILSLHSQCDKWHC